MSDFVPKMDQVQSVFRSVYNFDHGITTKGEFSIGPYRICVSDGSVLKEAIPHGVREVIGGGTFTSRGFEESKVIELPAVPGKWMPTAVVEEHPSLNEPSILAPGLPGNDGAYDLSLILTLLTGKHVAVGNGAEQSLPVIPGQQLVGLNFFKCSRLDWSKVQALPVAGGGEAIYALSLAMTSTNAQIKVGMAAAALDKLVARWRKLEKTDRYSKLVRKKFNEASKTFESKLAELEIDPEIVTDIMKRLPNMLGEAALSKLRAFLERFGMFPENAPDEALTRLWWLNTIRNSVAHSASIRLDLAENVEASFRVAGSVALITELICQVYILKYLLGIEDRVVDDAQQDVKEFFAFGTFRGQDVVTEDYEAFRLRLEAEAE
ncbi:hypothetical protein [Pseudomonas sp. S3_C01]